MHPLLVELSKRFDRLATRDQILEAISDLEALYDALDEIEQETVARLNEELYRRLGNIEA
jgi:hypothetical protein